MTAEQAVNALQHDFPSEQLPLPGTEAYETFNNVYLSARQSDYAPAAIFQPKNASEVTAFLQIVKENGVQFAIRGAGQQPLEACSNIQDGITLDLSRLTGIELKQGFVSVGAGERWGPVYEIVQAAGLGVGGSRSAKGGIGGLSLSGGLSFFSSREGFICDNVVNFEVVLASGAVVQANAHQNADLWRALKGGGNNFGVVTRYDLRTFPQQPFWGGAVFYLASDANYPKQVEALVDEVRKPDPSDETHIMVNLGYSAQFGDNMMGLNQVYYTGGDAASVYGVKDLGTGKIGVPPMLEPFTSVQPQLDQLSSLRVMTLMEGATEHAVMASDRVRCAYMNCTLRADTAALLAAADIYSKAIDHLKPIEGIVLCLTLQAYPKSLLRKTNEFGGNVLGIDAGEPLVTVLLLTYWKNKEDDEQILAILRGALEAIEKDAEKRGQRVPYIYLNYASGFQDPFTSYGEENKKFLQEVSRKYDPEGLFQRNVPGGFKLFA
ncbi:FAD-binding domain-containing protein [Annulohypoxylon truncatum]|uniref:FAD-binding domain-containing protein n=1 Tax=Annulohypoxylon truncatum TaxID=327061 RepID=UPI00200832D5|nr:FAD-binding domain-containing protein [Annulohypoxylon truncatum]KAI1205189.1 FAD-binding domain-containing protein [Annulohypoxylon truncatum]